MQNISQTKQKINSFFAGHIARTTLLFVSVIALIIGVGYTAFAVVSARADNPPSTSLTFEKSAHNFELTVNTTHDMTYLLSYVHTDFGSYTQEGVTGSGSDASGIIKKTIYM